MSIYKHHYNIKLLLFMQNFHCSRKTTDIVSISRNSTNEGDDQGPKKSASDEKAFWFRFAAINDNTPLHKESLVFFKCFCIHPWIYTREPYFASHNSFCISSGHSSYGKCPKVYLKYESNRVHLDKINVNVFLTQRQQNFFDWQCYTSFLSL